LNAANFKVHEAVQMIQFVASYADAETVEVLDRIIGGNIHTIQVQDAIHCLKAFMVSE
jgi:hypothetical protein